MALAVLAMGILLGKKRAEEWRTSQAPKKRTGFS
jgi:hypothetical protein